MYKKIVKSQSNFYATPELFWIKNYAQLFLKNPALNLPGKDLK